MTLFKSDFSPINVSKTSKVSELTKLLSERELKWCDDQKIKLKERIELKMSKSAKSKDDVKRLLQNSKSWQGPCLSGDELMVILKKHPKCEAFIVETEMAYYAHAHKADKITRPDLFRLSVISKKLENLSVLLTDVFYDTTSTTEANLPTNQDLLNVLTNIDSTANDEVAAICPNTGDTLAIA